VICALLGALPLGVLVGLGSVLGLVGVGLVLATQRRVLAWLGLPGGVR